MSESIGLNLLTPWFPDPELAATVQDALATRLLHLVWALEGWAAQGLTEIRHGPYRWTLSGERGSSEGITVLVYRDARQLTWIVRHAGGLEVRDGTSPHPRLAQLMMGGGQAVLSHPPPLGCDLMDRLEVACAREWNWQGLSSEPIATPPWLRGLGQLLAATCADAGTRELLCWSECTERYPVMLRHPQRPNSAARSILETTFQVWWAQAGPGGLLPDRIGFTLVLPVGVRAGRTITRLVQMYTQDGAVFLAWKG
jgi:hypothetical protein